MHSFIQTARVAPIVLVILASCTPPNPPPSSTLSELAELPPSVQPVEQPRVIPPPKPTSSVPEDTRDPVLVERGVREWLANHPDYQGHRRVAMLHRMKQESGFQPCARNGPHHHLLQWSNTRRSNLYRHANVRHGTCPSWLAQLRYMDWEIKNNKRYTRFLHTNKRDAYQVFTRVYLGGKMGHNPI